jgi:hypothetical protein
MTRPNESNRRQAALLLATREGWAQYVGPVDPSVHPSAMEYRVMVPAGNSSLSSGPLVERVLPAAAVLPWVQGLADGHGVPDALAELDPFG